MRFNALSVEGALLVVSEPHLDERGSFLRAFDADAFAAHGFDGCVAQVDISTNLCRGTLRGVHYQIAEHAEAKIVRVTSGAVFDVLVDLRKDSATYCKWTAIELRADDGRAVLAPPGVAHGFLTLGDDTQLLYVMSRPYVPEAAAGVRWDDPVFSISWPFEPVVMSERDRQFADFEP